MDFTETENQKAVRDQLGNLMREFDDDYWLNCDTEGTFPKTFYDKVAAGGWLGIALPKKYGGSELGFLEAAVMMREIADSGGGMTAASAIHINMFGPQPIAVFGTHEQKQKWLPPLISGNEKCCFGVTEPNAGLDTGKIQTFAKKNKDRYLVNGQKIWTSTAKIADKIMLLVRTKPLENCTKRTDGLTLFYTKLDRSKIKIIEIKKMGRAAVDSNQLFITNLSVPNEDRIGEENKGFEYLIHSLNPERILIAAEAIGMGRNALNRAVSYAKDRVVFGRSIDKNQSIQHPLAKNWIELEAADLLMLKAAYQYDQGHSSGGLANAAKYFAAEACFQAAHDAIITLGGMGYAKDFHVERLMRESMIPKLAPISSQMILNYIAERILGFPKSY